MSETNTCEARDATRRIVVGVDGSPSSEEALRWAVRQGRLTGHPVDAVIAWDWPIAYGVAPGDYVEDLRGHPAHVLLHASAGAEMLVADGGS